MKRRAKLSFLFIIVVFFLAYSSGGGEEVSFNSSLDYLPFFKNYKAKRISSYDRKGENYDAMFLASGETVTLAEIKGPGCITHIWCTLPGGVYYGRKIVLRMYWDDEENPSVEAPLGDFFGVGHGLERDYSSLPFAISSGGQARNCFFKMPFLKSARIELTNESYIPVPNFYYYIDYRLYKSLPEESGYFHAQYNQAYPCDIKGNYVILDAKGKGHYVGCNMSIESTAPKWWGEGDDMIYIDGESLPSLHGTGTEDYFCDAFGMHEFWSPYYGCPLCEGFAKPGERTTMYRFHIEDPIPFEKDIRVTMEHGTENDRADNLSSVAYWYQAEPHVTFAKLPPVRERLPKDAKLLHDFEFLLYRAERSETTKELGELVNDCAEFIRMHPDFKHLEQVICLKGVIHQRRGEFKEANIEYERVILRQPSLAADVEKQIKIMEREQSTVKKFKVGDALILDARNALGWKSGAPFYVEQGAWRDSSAKSKLNELLGKGARCTNADRDICEATFTPKFPKSGIYEVFVTWSDGANAQDVQYIIKSREGEKKLVLEQHGRGKKPEANCDVWHSLGEYVFKEGLDKENGSVTINAKTSDRERPTKEHEFRVYADSIKFVLKKELPI